MFKKNKFFATVTVMVLLISIFPLVNLAQADTGPTLPAIDKGQTAVFTIGSDQVTVNGRTFTMDVAPYIDSSGRTMVPVRYLGEVLGMTANWNAAKQLVTLNEQKFSAQESMTIGSSQLGWADGTQDGMITMDTEPVIAPPGRTMLPARYVAQAIGYSVTWNVTNQTVTVSPQSNNQSASVGGNNPPLVGVPGINEGGTSGTNPGPDSQPPVSP